jgi:hypothetical protein
LVKYFLGSFLLIRVELERIGADTGRAPATALQAARYGSMNGIAH